MYPTSRGKSSSRFWRMTGLSSRRQRRHLMPAACLAQHSRCSSPRLLADCHESDCAARLRFLDGQASVIAPVYVNDRMISDHDSVVLLLVA